MQPAIAFEARLAVPYEAALERVAEALKAEGFGILTRIDVRATLKDKLGEEFRPYSILGACNPPLAHRALTHEGKAGLMLPCNVTVEADPTGGSLVRIADPEVMLDVGSFGKDPELRKVATEARQCLARAAASLRQTT